MSYDIQDINDMANGLWHDIIPAVTGCDQHTLTRKGSPCPSCGGEDRFIFDDIEGRGTWHCRQCGGKQGNGGAGDGISLVMRINGWTFPQACQVVGEWLNAPDKDFSGIPRYRVPREKKAKPEEDWSPIDPQPEEELHLIMSEKIKLWNPNKQKQSTVEPKHVAIIRNQLGVLKGAVIRFEVPDKKTPGKVKKIPSQVMYCVNKVTGESRWVMHGLGADKPLYGIEQCADKSPILVVQGERKRDIVAKNYSKYPCVSIVGGDGAIASMDLTPLHGKTVIVWPDNDWEGSSKNSGMRCARRIAERLEGKADVKIIIPPGEEKPSGWDLGDAFESDGWTEADLNEYAKSHIENYSGFVAEELAFENEAPAKEKKKEQESQNANSSNADTIIPKFISFLGYDRGTNYYYCQERKQVIAISASKHSKLTLIALAPEEVWQSCFYESVSETTGQIKWSLESAVNYLSRKSVNAGMYDPEKIRAGGCWFDEKRIVMHLGDHLVVDGVNTSLGDFKTKFIYERRPCVEFSSEKQMLPSEAKFITKIADSLHWKNKDSAKFMLGWALLAPICGTLKKRPHLWLTGSSGCGKSTVLGEFLKPLLGGLAQCPNGSSTEAGIRQSMSGVAAPIIMDEAEGHDKVTRERIQSIITLARTAYDDQSSNTARGSAEGQAKSFKVRSMFGFAAINNSMEFEQDINRIAVLELRNPSVILGEEEARRQWKVLCNSLTFIDQDLGQRMVTRTMSIVNKIHEAIDIVKPYVSSHTGSARLADTYGTLLAGYWMLGHDEPPTEYEAQELAENVNWPVYIDPELGSGGGDSSDCLAAILQIQVRGEINGRSTTATIGELVDMVHFHSNSLDVDEYNRRDARVILGRYGIRADDDALLIANKSSALSKNLVETQFGAGWKDNLQRIEGAKKGEKVVAFGPGVKARCTSIPWSEVPV